MAEVKRFLRLPRVIERTGFSKTTIYEKISLGEFPKPYSIGGRAVAWLESDIDSWIDSKTRAA